MPDVFFLLHELFCSLCRERRCFSDGKLLTLPFPGFGTVVWDAAGSAPPATARLLRRLACCDGSLAATLCRVRKVLWVSGRTFPPRLEPLTIRRGDEMFLLFTTTVEVKGQTLPSQGACGFQPTPGASVMCWWGHSLPPALSGPQGSCSPPSPLGIPRGSLSPPACTKLSFRLFFTSGQYLVCL